MKQENLNVLDKITSVEVLKLIKSEAEMVLDESISSENIITNKANTIFQIVIVVVFSLIGYIVNSYQTNKTNTNLSIIVFFLIFVCAYSIFYLVKIMYPRNTFSKGSTPSKILFDDIVVKNWEEISILKNRIYCLEKSIIDNKKAQSERIIYFKKAIDTLLIGLILVVIYCLFVLVYS